MPPISSLLSRRIIMVTGKGGVGKTSVSSLIACAAAASGKRVCIVQTSAVDQISKSFAKPDTGHDISQLTDLIFTINIDATLNFRDFIVKHLGFVQLFDKVFTSGAVKSFIDFLPGVKELTLLGRLYYLAELSAARFDLVILDGFSSGHFLSLLNTPDAIIKSGIGGPIVAETRSVTKFLNTPGNSGIVFVTTPEPLIMDECLDFIPQIINTNLSNLEMIVVNRYLNTTRDTPGNSATDSKWSPLLDYLKKEHESDPVQKDRLVALLDRLGSQGIEVGELADFGEGMRWDKMAGMIKSQWPYFEGLS